MTITTSSNSATYTGDAVSVAFAFPYPFITNADLKVYVAGILQSSGYSVAGTAPIGGSGTFASGTVTFTSAPANAAAILIYCDPDTLQSTSLPPNDPFPSKTVEKMIDKLTLLVQRLAAKFLRAIVAPDGESGTTLTLPSAAARASNLLAFDSLGNVTTAAPVAGTATALAIAIANAASAAQGAGQVGWASSNAYPAGTAGFQLNALTLLLIGAKNIMQAGTVAANGVTDDAAAINAILAPGGFFYFPPGTYQITTPLLPATNSIIFGAGAQSLIRSTSGDITQIYVNTKSKVVIRDLGIQATNAGTTANKAGIMLEDSTDCVIEHNDLTGLSDHGVYLRGACLRNTVRANYIHNGQGTVQDASDVMIYSQPAKAAPAFNIVTGNFCFSGNANGILLQDPYTLPAVIPARNTIEGNFVGQHTTYGIAAYMPNEAAAFTAVLGPATAVLNVTVVSGGTLAVGQDVSTTLGVSAGRILSFGTGAGGTGTYNMSLTGSIGSTTMVSATQVNSHNKIALNHIDDIQGSYATNRDSGAGVYVVGAGAGATAVVANTIRNCCVQTLTESLTPGGIGVNGIPSGCAPVVVEGNLITDMPAFHGIVVAGGNCIVKNNSVTHPSANPTGIPFKANLASNVTVSGNSLTHLSTANNATVALVYANGANITGFSIVDNQIIGGGYAQIVTQRNGAFSVADLLISNNRLSGIGTTGNASISFESATVTGASLSGNIVEANTVPALLMVAATNVRVSGGLLKSTGTININTSGVCTNGFLDDSVDWGTVASKMSNAGTGFNVEWRSNAMPAAGSWVTGDRTQQSVYVAGTTLGWDRITTGSGNVLNTDWKAEAVL